MEEVDGCQGAGGGVGGSGHKTSLTPSQCSKKVKN